jgi:signal transduction histidine kinase
VRRLRFLVAVIVAVLSGILTWRAAPIAGQHPETSIGGDGWIAAVVQVAAVALLAGVGTFRLFAADRRWAVPALLLGSAFTCAVAIPPPDAITQDLWFTVALITAGATGPLTVCVALLWPAPARPLAARAALVAMVPILLTGLLPTVVYRPTASGCNTCAQNLIAIASAPGLREFLLAAGLVANAAWCLAAATILVLRLIRLPRTARPAVGPVLVAGLGIAMMTALAATHVLTLTPVQTDRVVQLAWLTVCGLAAIMATGIAASSIVYRRAAQLLTRRVLTASPDAQTLRGSFADLVGDPELQLVLNPEEPTASVGSVAVVRQGATVAEIRFDPRFADAAPRLSDAVHSAALAVEYAAAQDALAREEAVLLESRQRIVRTGDETRYAIERNLHDGAQQRLVALSLQALAVQRKATIATEAAALEQARHELAVALDELRSIAHGLFPTALHDDGLAAALLDFRDRSPVPLAVDIGELPDLSMDAAMAVYRLVVDTVAGVAGVAATVQASVIWSESRLEVRLSSSGATEAEAYAATRHAADRLQALGGAVSVTPIEGGCDVGGWVPCGS